jgi:hypothetical protein
MRVLRPNGDVTVERKTKFSADTITKSPIALFFGLYAGVRDHFRPFLGLAGDIVAEMFG